MSIKIHTLAALSLADALAGINKEDDAIVVAGGVDCDPCQLPFGGRVDGNGNPPSVGDSSVVGAGGMVHSLLSKLGAQPCRVWGAPAPGQCQDENGCFSGKKVCGAILPYRSNVAATATAYTIKAKKWFWPLLWVDGSNTNVVITDLTFQGDAVFENGVGSGSLRPSSMFPSDGTNFVPGLPAIDSTNGLDFTLEDITGTGTIPFEGMFIGISIRN